MAFAPVADDNGGGEVAAYERAEQQHPLCTIQSRCGERKRFIVVLGVVVGAFIAWCIVRALAVMLGKDIWPYSAKGPLRSTEEEVWMRKAIIEYEKQVPPP